jgi:hypothetical protein
MIPGGSLISGGEPQLNGKTPAGFFPGRNEIISSQETGAGMPDKPGPFARVRQNWVDRALMPPMMTTITRM